MARVYIRYEKYMQHPDVVKTCENCQRAECDGICDDYRDAVRGLLGLRPLNEVRRTNGRAFQAGKADQARSVVQREIQPKPQKPQKPQKPWQKRYEHNRQLEAGGERHTLREWAAISGINYNCLYMRMSRYGMSIEEAMRTPLRKICVAGKISAGGESLTVREWAARLGVTPNCIYGRIARGYTPEQAVTMERMV